MSKKKKIIKDGIYFYGQAADEVTGSMYLVKFGDLQILLECGLYQSSNNSYLDAYRINKAKFKFNPKEINYVFVNHAHIDHCGLLPRLVSEGFNGKIIMTSKTKTIVQSLLKNSCHIVNSEAKILSKQKGREYKPLYTINDYNKTIDLIKTYDNYNEIIELEKGLRFQWFKNSHCLGAAQLQLILSNKNKTKKILYTSDLGSLNPVNHYVDKTEIPQCFSDISIMESTYADLKRQTKKTRPFDIEHLKTAIETVTENKGSLIFPAFSFARTQELLTVLYKLYGDTDFKPLIYVDSLLSVEICRKYQNLLDGENLKLWNKVIKWKNLRLITDKDISDTIVKTKQPKIVISSSGFCTNGRIINYLKQYIKDDNSLIVFSGYVGDNPSYLSWRIKNYKRDKFIKINGQLIPNKAKCMTLYTFSSHINHDGLVDFGSSLNTNKLILVHGSEEGKKKIIPELEEKISVNNKTYKVVPSNKGMVIDL